MRSLLIKHNLIWLVLLLILIIGIWTMILSVSEIIKQSKIEKGFVEGSGFVAYPVWSIHNFQSHLFQNNFEKLIKHKLRLKNWLIQFNSQIYYSLFDRTFGDDNPIIVGKNNQLFQKDYIIRYCHLQNMPYHDSARLIDWANKIKKLSDFFEKRGKVFVYLITPSKAEYMSEAIPDRFNCSTQGMSQHLIMLEKLLTERGVRTVNGPALMFAAKSDIPISLFPKGGTHWNWLGSSIAANAVINTINKSEYKHLQPLHYRYSMIRVDQRKEIDTDDDLLNITKVIKPDLSYRVPEVHFYNLPKPYQAATITFIGGSFVDNLVNIFERNKLFSKINYYFYFHRSKISYDHGKKTKDKVTSAEVLKSLFTSNIIVLEENSSITISDHGRELYSLIFT